MWLIGVDATVGCLPYIWVQEQRRRQNKTCVALVFPHKFSSSLPRHRAHGAQQEAALYKEEAVVYKQEADSLMLRFTILATWRWHAGMFSEAETTTLYVDHGKRQGVALKYHLGISKMLVLLDSVAKLLVRMVNSAVVFFFTSDLHLLPFVWTKRDCVKHWAVKKTERGRKGKTISHLAWLIQAEKWSFRILQCSDHVCKAFLCKQIKVFT